MLERMRVGLVHDSMSEGEHWWTRRGSVAVHFDARAFSQ